VKCSECRMAADCEDEGSNPKKCDYYESENLTETEAEDLYDEMLDEVYGLVEIAGLQYETSRILKEIDPIAYRCKMMDWLDSEGWEVE